MMEEKVCKVCSRIYQSEKDYLRDTSRWRMCNRGHLWFNCDCGSTLMIKKGKYDWYDPSLFMSGKASGVFNQLTSLSGLPSISMIACDLQSKLLDETISVEAIADLFKQDPLLSAQLIASANLKKHQHTTHIKSIEHALIFLGRKTVYELVSIAAVKTFEFKTQHYTGDIHWQHALLTGLIAEQIRFLFSDSIGPDEAFLAGSLANIGKLVASIVEPHVVDAIYSKTKDIAWQGTWSSEESKQGFPSHEVLGEIGAVLWGLPECVVKSVYHHKGGSDEVPVSQLVGFANIMSYWISSNPSAISEMELGRFKRILNFNDEDLSALAETLLPLRIRADKMIASY